MNNINNNNNINNMNNNNVINSFDNIFSYISNEEKYNIRNKSYELLRITSFMDSNSNNSSGYISRFNKKYSLIDKKNKNADNNDNMKRDTSYITFYDNNYNKLDKYNIYGHMNKDYENSNNNMNYNKYDILDNKHDFITNAYEDKKNKRKHFFSKHYNNNHINDNDSNMENDYICRINEHNYINICHFILNIFELYTLSLNNISFLKILINIGRLEPFLFLKTLHYISGNIHKKVSSINKILFLLIILIKNYKCIFIWYMNIIIDILLNSLDPSNNVRILCLKLSTSLIYTLVKYYNICSFNKFTQKLAVVNNINKCIYLYDLKSAKKLKIFQGHKKYIDCIKFNTNGTALASYSKLDLSFKLWNCTNVGLFSGFLKIQSKCTRDIQLSKIKSSYLYLSDSYIDITYKKKNEWILKREDNAIYLIYI